ncbi:ribose 5-phosphate isomerase A, partial [Methylobacterium radiotolerans]
MVVIATRPSDVARLGAFPLPVEVNPFGLKATHRRSSPARAAAWW